jgi:D-aminopeptidase
VTGGRARARDRGLAPGRLLPGLDNAITDVPGIRVGHATLIERDDIRTGVTAIVHDALVGADTSGRRTLAAGLSVFNGFGKMVGPTQLTELGTIETPVLLTSTLSVFRVADALLSYLHDRPGFEDARTLNPIVAETSDAYLSDIWARPITSEHVAAALDSAASGPVAEGCVGAGTGTGALGYKAGIGTSSRLCEQAAGRATVGVLVQANFGGELTVLGVPCPPPAADQGERLDAGNSCVIVIATDAQLDTRQLTRLAARAAGGMARAGSDFSGRSGDYALAASTAGPGVPGDPVPDKDLDLLFLAAIEATEEAILNSLFMAESMTGAGGRTRQAVSLDYVMAQVSGRSAGRSES